ncbi:MAG: hypothetical protein ACREDV_11335, partial [Methylocella sp.]
KQSSEPPKALLKKYTHLYVDMYDNLLGSYGVLQKNAGKYFVKGPASVILNDSNADAEFNLYINGLRRNAKDVTDIQERLAAIQKSSVSQIIRSTHN